MSKTKGFVAKVDHSEWQRDGSHDILGLKAPHGAARDIPVLSHVWVQPIEDESLPHPGDGKEWERRSWAGSDVWHKVNILAPPVHDSDGSPWVLIRYVKDGDTDLVVESTLRERKPEPEHKPWCCKESKDAVARTYGACTCERRSGMERREGERRSGLGGHGMTGGRRPRFMSDRDTHELRRGRRSGSDRRQSS